MRTRLVLLVVLFLLSQGYSAAADNPQLPFVSPIFGDNMVLQRGKPNTIWGWSTPGQMVQVEITGHIAKTVTAANGRWQVRFEPPAPGGPYTIKITGPQTIVLHEVLVGLHPASGI